MILYHGSYIAIPIPDLIHSRKNVDFGCGFYTTPIYEQAVNWSEKFKRRGKSGIISRYQFDEKAYQELNVLQFDSYSEEWLDFVINCRRGIEHSYDIVSEPMADDTIWDYIEDYIEGKITREAFWVLVKIKYPTHQIVFATEQALRCLTFVRSYEL